MTTTSLSGSLGRVFVILLSALIVLIVYYGLGYVCVGAVKRKPNVILKEDSEYLYVRKYTLYNKDSCTYRYHKPIIYRGVVTYTSSRYSGIPGKGGHRVYRTHIEYDDHKEHVENGLDYYHKHKEGDTVMIKVSFYPWLEITPLN
jgi:hypothetical protein